MCMIASSDHGNIFPCASTYESAFYRACCTQNKVELVGQVRLRDTSESEEMLRFLV